MDAQNETPADQDVVSPTQTPLDGEEEYEEEEDEDAEEEVEAVEGEQN